MSFVSPSSWELASLLCKLALYSGLCTLTGCLISLAFYHDGRRQTMQGLLLYGLVGSVLGFHGVLLNYLIQVGMISGNGLAGMFDLGMIQLLLDTPQGESTLWRLLAFTLAFIILAWGMQQFGRLNKPPTRQHLRRILLPLSLTVVLLAGSFQMSGHVSVLGTSGQLAIALHVIAFACWIGSLLPLYWLARRGPTEELGRIMSRFGDHARYMLAVLVVAGGLMLWQLLSSPMELLQTAYGLSLKAKFVLVVGLMLVAAANRFTLVPALAKGDTDAQPALRKLSSSIRLEMALAVIILLITAYLSTLVGPMDHTQG